MAPGSWKLPYTMYYKKDHTLYTRLGSLIQGGRDQFSGFRIQQNPGFWGSAFPQAFECHRALITRIFTKEDTQFMDTPICSLKSPEP